MAVQVLPLAAAVWSDASLALAPSKVCDAYVGFLKSSRAAVLLHRPTASRGLSITYFCSPHIMQRCGKCKPCLNPHFKQACTEVKAARELDRSSHRSSYTNRRARLSATNIPLARLDHEAAITTAEAQHEEQLSNKRFQRERPSPSAVSDAEQHCLSETAQAKKRAATEDSDNYGCNKKICFIMHDPEQTAAKTAASPATADPESCFIQVQLAYALLCLLVLSC